MFLPLKLDETAHRDVALPVIDPRSHVQVRPPDEGPLRALVVLKHFSSLFLKPFVVGFLSMCLLYSAYLFLNTDNVGLPDREAVLDYPLTQATGTVPQIDVPEHIQRLWGQYSPYFPAGNYVPPPKGCNITQVNILQRHGARFPTATDAPTYKHAIHALASARAYSDARLAFLDDYEYDLGEEALIPLGARQSRDAGAEAWTRYRGLLRGGEGDTFVRASDSARVVDSAGNWTQGLAAASGGRVRPTIDQLLSEEVNNTLHSDCPNASTGTAEMDTWLHRFAPRIAARLNAAARGANASEEDVFGLLAMCPFESAALARVVGREAEEVTHKKKKRKKAKSPFCALFDEDEWRAFEFHGDVEKYYKTGHGNPLGRIQGVGYAAELLARLTDTPPANSTTHNASLPFPLRRALYADFSHESEMVAVFAALGLFDVRDGDGEVPDPHKGPGKEKGKNGEEDRVWVASRLVPFSARMVTERLECAAPSGDPVPGVGVGVGVGVAMRGVEQVGLGGAAGHRAGTYVRIFVNDALQLLASCGAHGDGVCALADFVESQGYVRRGGDGDFERCYR